MKKILSKIFKILIIIFFLFIGFCVGLLFGSQLSRGSDGIARLFELIGSLFLAYNLVIIIHEGGHLVFGLLTGYKFSSFRICVSIGEPSPVSKTTLQSLILL